MSNEKKRLFENFISLSALQIVSYVIPLISLPYLSRVLGVEYFGIVFFAFATMQYFIVLTDFGFSLSATREIAINRHNINNISNIFSSVLFVKSVLLFVSFVILCLMIIFIPKFTQYWKVFLFSFLMVVGNAIYPIWFFQGMERMKYITFINVSTKTLFLILIFIFVKKQSDFEIVALLNSMGFFVSGLIGLYFAYKEFGIRLYKPKLNSLKKQFKYSSEFFLSRVSVSLYTDTNTFCLGLIGSNIMVGYYVAADKIFNAINGLQGPLCQALYPYVAKYKDINLYKKLLFLIVIINTFICIFVFCFAQNIITIFYGAQMVEAYKILRIFCLTILLIVPAGTIGYPLLGALGHANIANKSVIFGSIVHVIGLTILFFTKNMNVYSIAYMVFITQIVVFSIRMFFVLKYKLLSINVQRGLSDK